GYDGSPKPVTVTTSPAGLSGVSITYNGSATAPTDIGSYSVVASLNNANYTASNATGTLTITKGTATLTLSNLTQTYDGSAKPVTVTVVPAGLQIAVTYDGHSQAPTNAGSYAVVASLVGNDKKNYNADDATGTLTINKATATITLSNLTQSYNRSTELRAATTSPSGVTVLHTKERVTATATNAARYTVVAA